MRNPGLLICKHRLRKGYTQAQLANQCGIPQPNLSNIEKGKQDFTVSTLLRIADALEIKPSQLIEEEVPAMQAPLLTRPNLEAIAEAVVNPKAKVSKEIRYWASLFKIILPQHHWRQRNSIQKINLAWFEVRKQFTLQDIKGIGQRVEDAFQRNS